MLYHDTITVISISETSLRAVPSVFYNSGIALGATHSILFSGLSFHCSVGHFFCCFKDGIRHPVRLWPSAGYW